MILKKKALCAQNIMDVEFFIYFHNYVSNLKFLNDTPLINSIRKTGLIGLACALNRL